MNRYQAANNRINTDWQFRCAPLTAGYLQRYASVLYEINI